MVEKIAQILRKELNLGEDVEITAATSLKDDLGADSLDLFEMVMTVEDEYGIEVPVEQMQELNTVGEVAEFFKSLGFTA